MNWQTLTVTDQCVRGFTEKNKTKIQNLNDKNEKKEEKPIVSAQ